MTDLAVLTQVYVDSGSTTTLTASANTFYVVDTAAHAVTITLPAGVAIGNWIIVLNAPLNGPQMGGTVPGHTITVAASGGETIEGSATTTRTPPTSLVTAATSRFWPVGAAPSSGFGAGWAKE